MKPLGQKAYGSIPHLPSSRLGPGDYHISEGQAKIATEKKRDKNDIVIVQEKLDGSNVAIAKVGGEIIALTRAGYLATSSKYEQHHYFDQWVKLNKNRFDLLLSEGERICGEWLAMAHGTKYKLIDGPFIPFDIMRKTDRVIFEEFSSRVISVDFITPKVLNYGEPFSIEQMMESIKISGHGAIDPVEGAIWRVERSGKVDFLTKFVRQDKKDGKYFPELNNGKTIWNIDLADYLPVLLSQ